MVARNWSGSTTTKREYAWDTYTVCGRWGGFLDAAALCSDGKVRKVKRISETADTFFSVPAAVEVCQGGKKYTVSGYITVETLAGFSTEVGEDRTVVKFVAYQYGKNGHVLPRGRAKVNSLSHLVNERE